MRLTAVSQKSWPPQRLLVMLKDCKDREKETWRNALLLEAANKDIDIGPTERDWAVSWIARLNAHFNFYPETLFLAIHNLDRFLTAVKSRQKYLKCIAVTCLYIASKIMEEEEVIPGTNELVKNSDCDCRIQDILRMERIILNKLEWEIHTPTALTYLHIFHSLAFSNLRPQMTEGEKEGANKALESTFLSRHLNAVTGKLRQALCNYSLASFPSSALALAILSIEIENLMAVSSRWVIITSQLQTYAAIGTNDLMGCREVLMSQLQQKMYKNHFNNPVYIITNPSSTSHSKTSKSRKTAISPYQQSAIKRKANDTHSVMPTPEQVKKIHTFHCDKASNTQPPTDPHNVVIYAPETREDKHLTPNLATCSSVIERDQDGEQPPPLTSKLQLPHLACAGFWNLPVLRNDHALHRESSVGDLLEDSGISSECISIDTDKDMDGYDSDKTLTASEGEEDERWNNEEMRMRPLTYAEIVKCGILESTSTVMAAASATRAACL